MSFWPPGLAFRKLELRTIRSPLPVAPAELPAPNVRAAPSRFWNSELPSIVTSRSWVPEDSARIAFEPLSP